MKNVFSPFSFSVRLFQAQSILGFVSMAIPVDPKFNVLRERLFDACMAIIKCSDTLEELTGEKPLKEKCDD